MVLEELQRRDAAAPDRRRGLSPPGVYAARGTVLAPRRRHRAPACREAPAAPRPDLPPPTSEATAPLPLVRVRPPRHPRPLPGVRIGANLPSADSLATTRSEAWVTHEQGQ